MRDYRLSADQVAERRIARAVRRSAPPGGTSLFMEDTHLMSGIFFYGAEDLSEARLGSMLTRRMANQHGCATRRCWHRNHRRDMHYRATMLEVLGLPDGLPAPTGDDYILPGMRGRA